MNPRNGIPFLKPSAPKELRAFILAFRDANEKFLHDLESSLKVSGSPACFERLLNLIQKGGAFNDLAVQLHFGEEVSGEDLGWHRDGFNSLLHLAVSVRGHRALHTMRLQDGDIKRNVDVVDWQQPGCCYLASPTFVQHCPEYPESTFENRIIAIQARLLACDPADLDFFSKCSDDLSDLKLLSQVIAESMIKFPMTLPTMSQIEQFC